MNLWGFSESILKELKDRFPKFLKESIPENPLKCEYFLPFVVDELIREGKAEVTIFMYLCRCAKGKSEFVISRSKVLNDLKMGTDMYTNHLNKLKQSGYISSEPCRNEKGRICGIKFYINYPNSLKRLENNGFRKLEHE